MLPPDIQLGEKKFIFSFIFYLNGEKGKFYVVTEQTEPRFKS